MKKLFLFLITALIAYSGFSQVPTTITIPFKGTVVSKAPDATIVSTVWSFDAGSTSGGVIESPNNLNTNITFPAGTFMVKLTVKDNFNNSVTKISTIKINRANVPPVINITPGDTTITLGQTAMIINIPNNSEVANIFNSVYRNTMLLKDTSIIMIKPMPYPFSYISNNSVGYTPIGIAKGQRLQQVTMSMEAVGSVPYLKEW